VVYVAMGVTRHSHRLHRTSPTDSRVTTIQRFGFSFSRYLFSSVHAVELRCQSELCSVNTKSFAEICDASDSRLFNSITQCPHIIHIIFNNQLLPSVSAATENYNLRPRKYNRLLPQRTRRVSDANFIYRTLYSDIY